MNANDNNGEAVKQLLPVITLMPALHQAVVLRIIADGPITSAEIGRALDRGPTWMTKLLPTLRSALEPVATIEAYRGRGGGYVLRLLTDAERAESTSVVVDKLVKKLEYEPLSLQVVDADTPVAVPPMQTTPMYVEKPRRKKRLYKCPWPGGTFDLDELIAVNYDNDRVTVQMRWGSFQRGPVRHPDARAVAEHIEDTLANLDNVTMYSFADRHADAAAAE